VLPEYAISISDFYLSIPSIVYYPRYIFNSINDVTVISDSRETLIPGNWSPDGEVSRVISETLGVVFWRC